MGLGKTITSLSLINSNKSNYKAKFKNDKIYSKATLLICPSQLAKQWFKEAKRCDKNMKIILVTTKTNHSKFYYHSIANADLVIVTHQFLMNFKYYPRLNYANF